MKRVLQSLVVMAIGLGLPILVAYSSAVYWWFCITNPAKALAIAFQVDEMANVAANGKRNTTISARAARAALANRRWGCVLCKALDDIVPDHCKNSLE